MKIHNYYSIFSAIGALVFIIGTFIYSIYTSSTLPNWEQSKGLIAIAFFIYLLLTPAFIYIIWRFIKILFKDKIFNYFNDRDNYK